MANGKRVIIITPHNPFEHRGGLENYVLMLYSRLSKKFAVKILTFQGKKSYKDVIGIPGKDSLGGTYPILDNDQIIQDIEKIRPDVIILNTRFFYNNFLIAKYCIQKGIPYMHLEHGSGFVSTNNPIVWAGSRLYDNTRGKYVIKNASEVFATSKDARKFCENLSGRKDVKLLHSSIDISFFDGKKIKHDGIVLTFVGRLVYAKGVQDIIVGLKNVKEDVIFNVVGSGPYLKNLKKISGTDKRVRFLGSADKYRIRKILSETDIFIHPSYSEGGRPLSVQEACAMKCAVIATDVGGTRDVVKNNINGFLYTPKDLDNLRKKISIMLGSKNYIRIFQGKSREIIKNLVKQNKKELQNFIKTLKGL